MFRFQYGDLAIGRNIPAGSRFNLSTHNNLMLRSERRERLEAWAAPRADERSVIRRLRQVSPWGEF